MDYLTNNIDRHLNNIVFLRNAKTLEYIGVAPVFDSGTSLWLDTADKNINGKEDSSAKTFSVSQKEQLQRYVDEDYLEAFISKNIRQIPYAIEQIFMECDYDRERTVRIIKAVEARINDLFKGRSYKKIVPTPLDKIENIFSVEEDIVRKNHLTTGVDEALMKHKNNIS